jgi:hypothetical protein
VAQHRRSRPWRADDQRIEVLGSNGALRAENVVESAVSFAGADGIVRDKPLHFFLERYAEALPRRRTCRISSSGWPSSIGPYRFVRT